MCLIYNVSGLAFRPDRGLLITYTVRAVHAVGTPKLALLSLRGRYIYDIMLVVPSVGG